MNDQDKFFLLIVGIAAYFAWTKRAVTKANTTAAAGSTLGSSITAKSPVTASGPGNSAPYHSGPVISGIRAF